MRDPLNRANAPAIFRLFDACFKQGVIDAGKLCDDISAREFVDKHKAAFTFGVLDDEEEYDWRAFRFVLYRWARLYKLNNLAENYILFIKSGSYLWALLPFCMQFYLMGIEEWLEYPDPGRLELFRHSIKIHWNRNQPLRNFTKTDYISYMHEMAFAYRKAPEENRVISPTTMDGYCLALYNLTRKYVTKGDSIQDIPL